MTERDEEIVWDRGEQNQKISLGFDMVLTHCYFVEAFWNFIHFISWNGIRCAAVTGSVD